jgi:thymidylate synthase
MVALVRNHDYFEKALGNLIGLGHLLGYVCSETDLAPGELVCHSVHAYNSASKKALRDLVA